MRNLKKKIDAICNEFLYSRIGRVPGTDIRALTEDYCREMFALRRKDLMAAVDVLLEMEELDSSKAENRNACPLHGTIITSWCIRRTPETSIPAPRSAKTHETGDPGEEILT